MIIIITPILHIYSSERVVLVFFLLIVTLEGCYFLNIVPITSKSLSSSITADLSHESQKADMVSSSQITADSSAQAA